MTARTAPFEKYARDYDAWFDAHRWAFLSEVGAIRRFLPQEGDFLEVGVGTGRFAQILGIRHGLDPSPVMCAWAGARGIETCTGAAEALPFKDGRFDAVLMVTVVCFVDDLDLSVREGARVLKTGGRLVTGFVDANSTLGRLYRERRGSSRFYGEATFRTAPQVAEAMERAGLAAIETAQTLFSMPGTLEGIEPAEAGYGRGAFVAIAGRKLQGQGPRGGRAALRPAGK